MDLTAPAYRELFWDVDPSTLDPDRHAANILARILERGTWQQWKEARGFYGDARLREVLTRMRGLSRKNAAFCSVVLNIPLEEFLAGRPEPVMSEAGRSTRPGRDFPERRIG
jgi:hypothetical protein